MGHEYDVFISHSSKDKYKVVEPLSEELATLGLEVWYDGFQLSAGDSLRESIDEGLRSARFGIIVLSENFFEGNWAIYELNGLIYRHNMEGKVIIPLWYDIGHEAIMDNSPSIADIVSLRISEENIAEIAEEIYNIISQDDNDGSHSLDINAKYVSDRKGSLVRKLSKGDLKVIKESYQTHSDNIYEIIEENAKYSRETNTANFLPFLQMVIQENMDFQNLVTELEGAGVSEMVQYLSLAGLEDKMLEYD